MVSLLTLLPPLLLYFAQGAEIADEARESQDTFFDSLIWLFAIVPLAAAILIGLYNKKKKQTVQELDTASFRPEVLESELPILVHFYREWSIGDQVMIAQVEKIGLRARDEFRVGFVNIDDNPELLGLYSRIEPPALLLFAGGERIFQCEGVFDEVDVCEEVLDTIRLWRRRRAESS